MSLIPGLNQNHLFQEENYRMPSARIVQSQLTENFTNNIAGCIHLNLDMTFRVKVVEDQSFNEHLSQFGKGLSSSGREKARLRLFELRQFLNFRFKLIISNLIVINSSSIQLVFATSSSATTNPDSVITESYLKL